jgi:hypothetical protein
MEIKFKAWDEARNEMLDHGQFRFKYTYDGGISLHRKNELGIEIPIKNGRKNLRAFTGIVDKMGNEIYNGDILKVDNNDTIDMWMRGETGEVKFIPSRFTLCLKNGDKKMLTSDFEDCVTIIGNIYQNPDVI